MSEYTARTTVRASAATAEHARGRRWPLERTGPFSFWHNTGTVRPRKSIRLIVCAVFPACSAFIVGDECAHAHVCWRIRRPSLAGCGQSRQTQVGPVPVRYVLNTRVVVSGAVVPAEWLASSHLVVCRGYS